MKLRDARQFSFVAALVLLALAGYAVGQQPAPARVHITIIATTDLHGNILPKDYYTDKPDARGLAKAATIIKRARQ